MCIPVCVSAVRLRGSDGWRSAGVICHSVLLAGGLCSILNQPLCFQMVIHSFDKKENPKATKDCIVSIIASIIRQKRTASLYV